MVVSARTSARTEDPFAPEVTVLPGPPPAAVRALRTAVFVEEQGVPAELEHDAADEHADHAVVWDGDGQALATARLLDPAAVAGLDAGPEAGPPGAGAGPAGVIGRVAVRPDARGRGLGRAVTVALERRAAERGLVVVRLHAQASVAGMYAGLGYRSFGPRDVTAGIEHVWMARAILPGIRPVRDADGPELERLIGAVWSEYPGCVLDVDAEEPWLRHPAATYTGDVEPGPGRYRGAMWVVEDVLEDLADDAVEDVAPGAAGGSGDGAGAGGAPPAPRLAACVATRETGDGRVELKSLYVAATARRRGLGAALVRRVEREARRRGAGLVELWSDTRFTDAHRLYERLGYVATGQIRDLRDLSNTTEVRYTRGLPARP
ncbi:GNAT family N-acetyltransferase [Frankia sp. CNm7]|uniref:GNAT family N-acetyltransferase n=1 Tax=Frankia nepalensis TaxID=1836974 RepID=A0A937UUA3_9ACTN|nr:GNAT family N-acetyltransferase [Frankia nepalensis]MBL7497529.1 GNAT family N-acetyltransferase [Frankia nepalensis]MBL7510205.1 GNAT family N-acetyltransferase [Frankia nepalensis]MBL7524440.1 GNAT family N-acetyltransferase [Frankia nepalensis]MBL7630916.1 GNAT family N-acetyltransferase [Frankia nepalensis]